MRDTHTRTLRVDREGMAAAMAKQRALRERDDYLLAHWRTVSFADLSRHLRVSRQVLIDRLCALGIDLRVRRADTPAPRSAADRAVIAGNVEAYRDRLAAGRRIFE